MAQENSNRPRSLNHLPGVYHRYGSIPGSPLWTILSIIDELFGGIEDKIDNLPDYFDAELAPIGDAAGGDFLSFLSRWVALYVGKNWITEGLGEDESKHEIACRECRFRQLVRDAAKLYGLRGTPRGLEYMVETLCDVDVRVVERAWPRGLVIGVNSVIGVDTFIVERPLPAQAFVVLLDPSDEDRALIESSGEWLEVDILDEEGIAHGAMLAPIECRGVHPSNLQSVLPLRKINRLVEHEKPLHTTCYVGLESKRRKPEPPPELPTLVIGIESTIEHFTINGEKSHGIRTH